MNLIASAPGWLAAILIFLLLLAALEDSWRMEISNSLPAGIAIGALLSMVLGGPTIGLWQNFLVFAVMLVAGTTLFARGWMGGGDIKLLAASALWFDLANGWRLLAAIAIAGGIEALLVIALRRIRWSDGLRQRVLLLRRRTGIPYGVAIALGVALMIWRLRS